MKKFLKIIAILAIMIILNGCSDKTTLPSDNYESNNSSNDIKDSTYFNDGIAETNDTKIEIIKNKVVDSSNDNKKNIGFWYKITNKSNNEITPLFAWNSLFSAKQEKNQLASAPSPEDKYNQPLLTNIQKGQSVEVAVAYELVSDNNPVILTCRNGLSGNSLGEQKFEIK